MPADNPIPVDTQQLLSQTRAELAWLRDLGFVETKAMVLSSRFHLYFDGPSGDLIVTINPGMSAIEIWLRPPGGRGHGPSMQQYLRAHGFPEPDQRVDATSHEAAQRAVRANIQALRLLADHELAGNWTPLTQPEPGAKRRQMDELVTELVRRGQHPPKP
jgi:hypothetical protein